MLHSRRSKGDSITEILPPVLLPAMEFRRTNAITGDVTLVQIQQLGFDNFDKTRLVGYRNPGQGKRLDPGCRLTLVQA